MGFVMLDIEALGVRIEDERPAVRVGDVRAGCVTVQLASQECHFTLPS
jgi:hypothetical protein